MTATNRTDKPTTSAPQCALVIGHQPSAPGAVSVDGVSEYVFNSQLAHDVQADVDPARVWVDLVYRTAGYGRLPAQINALGPDFVIELHFNAARHDPDGDGRRMGTEVLYWHTSRRGLAMAALLQTSLVSALGLPDRGIKSRRGGERGAHLLEHTQATAVIAEPFFGDDADDWEVAEARYDALVAAYVQAIHDIGAQAARGWA